MMRQLRWDIAAAAALGDDDLVKLTRKLRWIGLEEEARRLEAAAGALNRRPFARASCHAD